MNGDGPWLVAAWPGMGAVGVLAAAYLQRQLRMESLGEVPPERYFDPSEVEVEQGLLLPRRYPRTTLSRWRNPDGPDLLLVLSEAQPQARGFALCQELIDRAQALGVERVVTFAAMASPQDPRAPSLVHATATDPRILSEARQAEAEPLDDGAISGMNGLLLAAAQACRLPGLCLLGEFPYFASQIPQPKAAAAVLRCFSRLFGLQLDLDELDQDALAVEERLTDLMERLLAQSLALRGVDDAGSDVGPAADGEMTDRETDGGDMREPNRRAATPEPLDRLDPAALAQIEALFSEVERDRSRALELKALLDRNGVFASYEDRFLDLFRHGE